MRNPLNNFREQTGRMGQFIGRAVNNPVTRPVGRAAAKVGDFAIDTGKQVGGAAADYFGFTDSGLDKADELYGINPRRAYWSNALLDLAGVSMGQAPQGLAQQSAAAQQQHIQQRQQQQMNNRARQQALMINAMNAMKDSDPQIVRTAKRLYPGDKGAQDRFILDYYEKRGGPLVDMGSDFNERIIDQVFELAPEAEAAQFQIGRLEAMKSLIPALGKTGTGAEAITNMRGFFNAIGGTQWYDFLSSVANLAGLDLDSGDLGARELFRALGNVEIIGQASELYPVSNSDINLLKQSFASLSGQSDPKAMEALIQQEIEKRNMIIDRYDYARSLVPKNIPPPPNVRSRQMDTMGVGDQLTPEEQAILDEALELIR